MVSKEPSTEELPTDETLTDEPSTEEPLTDEPLIREPAGGGLASRSGGDVMSPERRMLPWFLWAQILPSLVLGRWLVAPAVGAIVLIALVAWRIGGNRAESAGLLGIAPPAGGGMRAATILLLPALMWPRLIGYPFQAIFPDFMTPTYPGLGLRLAVATILAVPLMEEILYRGVLLNALRPWGRGPAILAGALVFGLGHGPAMFVSTAIVGWILGWLALEYDSIWPGFVIHAGFNLVAGVGVMAMEKLPHEVHGPLLLALLAVLVGLSVIVGIRERKLINRVIFEPLRQTPRPPGLWRPLGAIFRLWPVTVQTAISLIAWVAMLVDLPQTLQ